jgi:hypothetical protein
MSDVKWCSGYCISFFICLSFLSSFLPPLNLSSYFLLFYLFFFLFVRFVFLPSFLPIPPFLSIARLMAVTSPPTLPRINNKACHSLSFAHKTPEMSRPHKRLSASQGCLPQGNSKKTIHHRANARHWKCPGNISLNDNRVPLKCRWKDNIKMDLIQDTAASNGLTWFVLGTSGRVLWAQ